VIITLTGPSCGGKTTLERALQAKGWGRAISHTTREARVGEVNGEDYHFINDCTFDVMVARHDFVEAIHLGTRRYALSKQCLEAAHEKGNVVVVVDPHGAQQIQHHCEFSNNLPFIPFWVDCDPRTQAQRWLDRYQAQMGETVGAAELDALERANVERLGLMLGLEGEWRTNVKHQAGLEQDARFYQYFLSTDRDTPESLAEQIDTIVAYRQLRNLKKITPRK
jgi:guanylate kinase